ncbi:juvenile hormone esterase-like isoform X2 [Palaemon carinicauda]|uniref:juvenile hormone esterase-like isoform X2 n=1 Tax=Palaemon carinicauda TaxID=392227 RepID=UPI0035B61D77
MRFPRPRPPFLLLFILILPGVQLSFGLRTPLHSVEKLNEKFRGLAEEIVGVDDGAINAASETTSTPTPTLEASPTTSQASTSATTTTTPEPTTTTPEPTTTTPEPTTTTTPEPTTTATPVRVPRVTVDKLGTAIGTTLTSFNGREFYAFMSIPYAEAPVGDLRFRYPEPFNGSWPEETEDGEYEAVFLRARCVQVSLILPLVAGREDCLHLSIYTPQFPETIGNEHLPVMVWFHGGAYMTGDANLYVPTKLMDRDVMVVVVQYRLGTLGFLAGSREDSPGNMALMDQITALRWIQKYISNFGGDRDLVTVFGQSAGGASTSWMQLTPLTNKTAPKNEGRDLLHHMIPQSGSALELWTIDPNPKEGFYLTAATLNCNYTEVISEQLECMRNKTYSEIYEASTIIYSDDRAEGGLGFKALCPVVQTDMEELPEDFELVIPEEPLKTLERGDFLKVPMMAGTVRDEGSLVVGLAYKDYLEPNGHFPNDTEFSKYDAVPTLIRAFGLNDQNSAVSNTMRTAYFPYAEMGDWYSMVGGLIDMTGVLFLKSGLWSTVSHVNRADPEVPIYFYSWEFESNDSLFPWIFISKPDLPVPGGVAHADELLYLFHLPSDQDERQRNMTDKLITLWSNFAKYGDPTPDSAKDSWNGKIPKWELYNNDDYKFMLIRDEFEMAQDFTTRWNYHKGEGKGVGETFSRDDTAELVGERSEGDPGASRTPNDVELGNENSSYSVTLGIFEGFLVLVVVSGCIYAIFHVRKTRRNGIV